VYLRRQAEFPDSHWRKLTGGVSCMAPPLCAAISPSCWIVSAARSCTRAGGAGFAAPRTVASPPPVVRRSFVSLSGAQPAPQGP
jgi:hypothetical protein